MNYEEIGNRTIPQIEAILDGAKENISLKMGIPNMFGGTSPLPSSTPQRADKPPKLSQFMSFANAFNEI